jgi:hypothetical protein
MFSKDMCENSGTWLHTRIEIICYENVMHAGNVIPR